MIYHVLSWWCLTGMMVAVLVVVMVPVNEWMYGYRGRHPWLVALTIVVILIVMWPYVLWSCYRSLRC